MGSIITLSIVQSALELGFIYALVALALFISFSILNIADLSTDGCFTLGCAVCASVTLAGHPVLGLLAAMAAGDGCRCVFRFCDGIFADKTRHTVDSGRNYCQHRTLHNQYCGDGIRLQPESVCL